MTERLNFLLSRMNAAELGVMQYIAERLDAGREVYGPLNPQDGRDWRSERRQEVTDLLVYSGIISLSATEVYHEGVPK